MSGVLIALLFCSILIIWKPVEHYLPKDIKVILNDLRKKERGMTEEPAEPEVVTEEPAEPEVVTEEPAEPEVVTEEPAQSGVVKPPSPGDMAKPMKLSLNPFKLYDKNDDNFLTEDELKDGGAPGETITMLMGYDFNKDGKLSPSELTNIKPTSKQKDHAYNEAMDQAARAKPLLEVLSNEDRKKELRMYNEIINTI